jgi:NAD(P)-dependent dehydrogenase (short-subunit alcohol dehydrogenase family)
VSKHAAVAFAEWLAIHYADHGIHVACVCPQGVNTPMVHGAAEGGVGSHLLPDMIEPEAVADAVVRGLAEGAFLILPHPVVREYLARKGSDPDRWLRGMRRLRTKLYGSPS